MRFFFAFFRHFVKFFVIRERVRVRARDVCVYQRGAFAFARILHGFFANAIALDRVRSVTLGNMQTGITLRQFGNASARGLHLNWHRNRVAVVFHQINHRQFLRARNVQGFPEFAFARCAVARRYIHNLVALVLGQIAQRCLLRLCQSLWMCLEILRRLRRAGRLHKLCAGARTLAHDVELRMAPVARHLPAAGARIVFCANGLQKHLQRRHAH